MSARLRRFTNGQRVTVLLADAHGVSQLVNAPGTVARLRRADTGAWIALDARHVNENVHPFPADDETRSTHVLAYPEDCAPEVTHRHSPAQLIANCPEAARDTAAQLRGELASNDANDARESGQR